MIPRGSVEIVTLLKNKKNAVPKSKLLLIQSNKNSTVVATDLTARPN